MVVTAVKQSFAELVFDGEMHLPFGLACAETHFALIDDDLQGGFGPLRCGEQAR